MSSTKIEFAVQMTCEGCENAVKQSLENVDGVKGVLIDRKSSTVVVDTSLPTDVVQQLIASTGKKVVVKGLGKAAGVAILEIGSEYVQGVVRFVHDDSNRCVIDGTVDGLKPGLKHILSVHECGDTSRGCESVGDYYNPNGRSKNERIYGNLGAVVSSDDGRAAFRLVDEVLKIPDVIGRALVISEVNQDDSSKRVSCGIIARSAGLFQNPKTICACDGVSLWDEQNNASKPKNGI